MRDDLPDFRRQRYIKQFSRFRREKHGTKVVSFKQGRIHAHEPSILDRRSRRDDMICSF
jgi:hypothetical protein